MTTLNVTLPTGKAGQQRIFTIEFSKSNFDLVIDQVSKVTSIIELKNSKLWMVI
jgi:hypothetical protein